jgi:hypothetical protein
LKSFWSCQNFVQNWPGDLILPVISALKVLQRANFPATAVGRDLMDLPPRDSRIVMDLQKFGKYSYLCQKIIIEKCIFKTLLNFKCRFLSAKKESARSESLAAIEVRKFLIGLGHEKALQLRDARLSRPSRLTGQRRE